MRNVLSSMSFLLICIVSADWNLVNFGVCFCSRKVFIFGIWIISVGIELVLGTRIKSADVRRKTLLTAAGETISYKILIIATGARVLELIFNGLIFILL